jgi:hypothetical protein
MVVPGYPAVTLLEPYVGDLAAMLTTCIDQAVRRNESSPPEEMLAVQHRVARERE